MLPEYVFEDSYVFFTFFEGPLPSEEMKALLAIAGIQNDTDVDGINSQAGLSDESAQYTKSIDVWCQRSEEYLVGRLDANNRSVYYEVGWELIIVGFKQRKHAKAFLTDILSDNFFRKLYWNLDELVEYRIKLTSKLATSNVVRTFFNRIVDNYS